MRMVRDGWKPELARRLLLQARGDEGRRRVAPPLLLLDRGDGPGGAVETAQDLVDALPGVELELLVDLLAVDLGEAGQERRRLRALEPRVDRPVLLRHEGPDLALALDDEAHGDRLHAAGREAAPHLLPEQRRQPVADQPVEHAARLLRVEEVLVEVARVLRWPPARPSS